MSKRKSKVQYRKELATVYRILQPYLDRDKFVTAKSWREYPEAFYVGVDSPFLEETKSPPFATVLVNWKAVWELIRARVVFVITESGIDKQLSKEVLEALANEEADASLYRVLLLLPAKFDMALAQLLRESELGLASSRMKERGLKPPSLTHLAEEILDPEKRAIKARLGVKKGRTSTFCSKMEYERILNFATAHLITAGKSVTLGGIAEVLCETRSDVKIDERMIRRWNTEFGINWKEFKKMA